MAKTCSWWLHGHMNISKTTLEALLHLPKTNNRSFSHPSPFHLKEILTLKIRYFTVFQILREKHDPRSWKVQSSVYKLGNQEQSFHYLLKIRFSQLLRAQRKCTSCYLESDDVLERENLSRIMYWDFH